MSSDKNKSDKMPDRNSPEFDAYAERIERLTARDFCDLFELVGIRFPGTTREELEATPKYLIIGILDEADSRAKVEKFLKDHGV